MQLPVGLREIVGEGRKPTQFFHDLLFGEIRTEVVRLDVLVPAPHLDGWSRDRFGD
ncbi:hypothetical protein ACH4SK_06850 [Streptomyces inhibens]|uniref:hypothetical protein n=1 Tax=Streptomyces inhibens TaxID=2293571 RepID=UPI003791762C